MMPPTKASRKVNRETLKIPTSVSRTSSVPCPTSLVSRTSTPRKSVFSASAHRAGPFAAQTDLRIKACATAAAVCVGTMARRGYEKDTSNMDILKTQLEAADRNSDVGGEKVPIVHMLPEKPGDAPAEFPESFRDLMNYYCTPRAFHPRATNTTVPRSWDLMGNSDAFTHNGMISPRPLLMITGTKAAAKWYSEDAVQKAKGPKELYVVEGLTHADLYDKVDKAGAKCVWSS